jgi:predicted MFS family arabinose efflux permease
VGHHAVGFGEGFVLPSMNALVATQVAVASKARALGVIFSLFHCGNLAGLALSPLIILHYGWRQLFVVFGLLGAPMLAIWYAAMPERTAADEETAASAHGTLSARPRSHGQASSCDGKANAHAGQLAVLSPRADWAESPSVATFLRHKATVAIVVANFVNHWGYFIFLSWMPAYFAIQFDLDLKTSALMAFLPWIAMAIGSAAAGALADSLVHRFAVCAPRAVSALHPFSCSCCLPRPLSVLLCCMA